MIYLIYSQKGKKANGKDCPYSITSVEFGDDLSLWTLVTWS